MSSPISIVFVLPDLSAGGAQRVVLAIARGLDPARFSVRVIVLGRGDALQAELPGQAEVVRLGASGVLAALPRLVRQLRIWRPDIVMSVMGYLNLALLGLKPLVGGHAKYVVREANVVAATVSAFPSWFPTKKLYATLYARSDAIVSPTSPIAHEIRLTAPRAASRVIVIPNPVDEVTLRAKAVGARPGERGTRLAGAGRLTRQKGFDRLIDLMPTLPAGFNLTVYGEGPERDALQAQINERGLSGRVTLAGFSDRLPLRIAEADIFVLPSRWEGLPNVVLEALALGVPVVASPDSGVEDIASGASGGLTIAPLDERFVEAIERAAKFCRDGDGRPSLLPAQYRREAVLGRYSELFLKVVRQ